MLLLTLLRPPLTQLATTIAAVITLMGNHRKEEAPAGEREEADTCTFHQALH